MAHADPTATGYSEFGKGHYEDGAGRLYRVVRKEQGDGDQLPWVGLAAGVRVVADVRVQKRAGATKVAMARGEHGPVAQASLVFPRVGDVLQLRLVTALRGDDVDVDDALRARIRAVFSAGMDLDVVVKVHRERGRRRDDCVVAIVQGLDDKK